MGTNVYDYVDLTGVIVPDSSSILGEVQTEWQDTFGLDLVVVPSSPQGVIITGEALARVAVAANNAQLANTINPNVSGGTFFDAIWALTGGQRYVAKQTLVTNVTLSGVAGTVISVGTQAQTAAGDIFASLNTVTLNSGGNATVNFASVVYGAIPCASGALDEIVSDVLGWETVTNNGSGSPASVTTLGNTTQSDQQARAQRNNTLAFQGVSLIQAITSALWNVTGVTGVFAQENVSGSTETINGISMVGHSIYACVNGGSEVAIAAALLENKSSGCAWNGGTSVSVVEPASGQTYTVLYDMPTVVNVSIQVTTTNGNSANIVQAILDYAAGLIQVADQNGSSGTLPGFVIGANVSPFEIAAAIVSENPGYYISLVQVSLESSISWSTTPIPIAVNEIAATQLAYIDVIIS